MIPVENKLESEEMLKNFIVEGIAVIKRKFIYCQRGLETSLRSRCFEVEQGYKSTTEIVIHCTVEDEDDFGDGESDSDYNDEKEESDEDYEKLDSDGSDQANEYQD